MWTRRRGRGWPAARLTAATPDSLASSTLLSSAVLGALGRSCSASHAGSLSLGAVPSFLKVTEWRQ